MANSNSIISSPVRQVADVKTVLGESSNALSTLCKSTKINMWAKYKPVQFTGTRTTDWWKGRLLDCGIEPYKLSSRTSVADIVNHCDGTANGWTYYGRPNGTYPYRLLDFKGYNHNATPPVNSFRLGADTISNKSGDKLTAFIAIRYNASGDMLALSDIDAISPCYLGIYCRRSGTTTGYEGYCTTTIGNGGDYIEVSSNGWTAGTYSIYPFLSTASQSGVAADFYTIPMMSPQTLTVVAATVFVNVSSATMSGLNVSVTVVVTNRLSSSVTLSNNTWRTRPKYENENDPETVEDMSGTIANQTIAAGASKTITFTAKVTGDAADPSIGGMIYVYFSSATYKGAREIT